MEGDTYPDAAGYKETGGCSQAAANEVDAETLRNSVLAILRAVDLTADQTARRLGSSVLSIRPRLSELYNLGLIVKTGEKRKNVSGKRAAVWQAVRPNVQPNLFDRSPNTGE